MKDFSKKELTILRTLVQREIDYIDSLLEVQQYASEREELLDRCEELDELMWKLSED